MDCKPGYDTPVGLVAGSCSFGVWTAAKGTCSEWLAPLAAGMHVKLKHGERYKTSRLSVQGTLQVTLVLLGPVVHLLMQNEFTSLAPFSFPRARHDNPDEICSQPTWCC